MKKKLFTLFICLLLSIASVIALDAIAGWQRLYENGFARQLPSHKIVGRGLVKLDGNAWYFAGGDTSGSVVYLGRKLQGNKLLKVSFPRKDTQSIHITGFDTMKLYSDMHLRTTGSRVYLFSPIKGVVLNGNLSNRRFGSVQKLPFSTAETPLGNNQFILRIIQNNRNNSLVKLDKDSISKPFILEGEADSLFSNDGVLTSAPDGSKIFYSYYYRNLFYCLDSNLKLLYKGKSIDTVEHAQIKVEEVKSKSKRTISGPPPIVKSQIAATNKWLFIHSKVKADNETKKTLERNTIIDVYDVQDGKYQFSFYLVHIDGKVKDFKVYGNRLYALYDHCVYMYELLF